jgi:N-methylhydantoinase A
MVERGRHEVLAEGLPEDKIHVERYLDMRYRGQSYELTIPFSNSILDDFNRMHEHQYGYAKIDAFIEIVNLRVRAVGEVTPPPLIPEQPGDSNPAAAFLENRDVLFAQKKLTTPLYKAEYLQPGNQVTGPAVIVRSDTTILVGPADKANVDAFCNLIIEVGE